VEIKTGTADFSKPIDGSGPGVMLVSVIFPAAVQRAAIAATLLVRPLCAEAVGGAS